MAVHLLHGDCLEHMRTLVDNSVDAIVTDPPAGISFMGKDFDSDRGGRQQWVAWLAEIMKEALRVTKPGGHAFVWALPRTSHWTMTALEDAGWECRDVVTHLFGSGFPKSLDVSKAIDRKRNDDIRPVCRFLRAAMQAQGLNSTVIAERFGFHPRMVDHWAARDTDSQPSVPTWEQWQQLKALLSFGDEVDAEVWRLNGRKGKPGEAWYEREVLQERTMVQGGGNSLQLRVGERRDVEANITAPATDAARQWQGFGTSLKPAAEFWILCRKPLAAPSVAANVLRWNTGAINIDASRVGATRGVPASHSKTPSAIGVVGIKNNRLEGELNPNIGRWPSNVLLSHSSPSICPACDGDGCDGCVDGVLPGCEQVGTKRVKATRWGKEPRKGVPDNTQFGFRSGGDYELPGYEDADGCEEVLAWDCVEGCPVKALDAQAGESKSPATYTRSAKGKRNIYGAGVGEYPEGYETHGYGDQGGASRFYKVFGPEPTRFLYVPKASRTERNRGCEGLPEQVGGGMVATQHGQLKDLRLGDDYERPIPKSANHHPTVKPLALMRYLITLITPPGGVILDPFAGSGSTAVAAAELGLDCIAIEAEAEYLVIAEARIRYAEGLKAATAAETLPLLLALEEAEVV